MATARWRGQHAEREERSARSEGMEGAEEGGAREVGSE